MWRRALNLSLLIVSAIALWIADLYYPDPFLNKGFQTLLALAIIYLIFSILLTSFVSSRLSDKKTQYSVRKIFSILSLIFSIGAIITVWVTDPQTLVVSYGLFAAGLAIALQDVFKNLAGGFIIFIESPYRVGDRVMMKDVVGDVIDIGIMYTTLLELREWVDGDQATGRLVILPNGHLLSGSIYNYTKDNNFLWDELVIPISYDNDWKAASKLTVEIVKRETAAVTAKAEAEIAIMMGKYYLTKREVESKVNIVLTSNYIEFHVRYICETRGRRGTRNTLSRILLEEYEKNGVVVGSSTLEITKFPDLGR
ncbi:MAG: mechanosensitive ion channel family protein [Methanomassiliicoccales archaeon]|nr:mechanosensitive ion channel family protein [Methanomassiliicoccales archaeon]TFG56440.1 MAG: mechanosensitive ion channel [Methanomassiliicoccus sp.]